MGKIINMMCPRYVSILTFVQEDNGKIIPPQKCIECNINKSCNVIDKLFGNVDISNVKILNKDPLGKVDAGALTMDNIKAIINAVGKIIMLLEPIPANHRDFMIFKDKVSKGFEGITAMIYKLKDIELAKSSDALKGAIKDLVDLLPKEE